MTDLVNIRVFKVYQNKPRIQIPALTVLRRGITLFSQKLKLLIVVRDVSSLFPHFVNLDFILSYLDQR